ncbi:TrkH family potassium uptake protein [bacterium]|nr:TrkH family potassium uptake protein [bacterium]
MHNPKAVFHVIAAILILVSLSIGLSFLISLFFRDGDSSGLAISAGIVLLVGLGMYWFTRNPSDLSFRDGFAVVTFGWLAMSLFGAIPYLLTGAIPSFTDAFFESASGFTTTGSSILSDIEGLPRGILFWRSFTHWIGGMGIIVFSIAILPFLGVGGMQMFKAESPGPTADKLTPRIKGTAEILWVVYVVITIAEILLLKVGGMTWFDSACHSFGTLATGGFSTKNTSIAYYSSPYIHYVITFFMFVAGVNFSMHFRAMRGDLKNYWSSPEFKYYTYVTLAAIGMITLSQLLRGNPIEESFRESAFQVVSITTTTGYATANFELWHPLSQLILVSLMFMGGMAGSTGGGMKVIRIMVLIKQARVELHKMIHPQTLYPLRIGKNIVHRDIVGHIMAFILLYFLIMLFGTLVMSLLGVDHITALTSVIACLSNIGPGLGNVGPAENFSGIPLLGKWLLSMLMIVGRLEIYTVLILLTKTYWKR